MMTKSLTIFSMMPVLLLGVASKLQAEEKPPAPKVEVSPLVLSWSYLKGNTIKAQFLGLSGDQVTLLEDGRILPVSISLLSAESARQARRLAGIDEPLAPVPVVKPLAMKFEPVSGARIDTTNPLRQGRLPIDRKKLSYVKFLMGSPPDEAGRENGEPLHTVRLGRDFYLKATEVTWAEWQSVRKFAAENGYTDLSPGENGQRGADDGRHPVLGITWWDAIKWCNLLSQLENLRPVYYIHDSKKLDWVLRTGQTKPEVDWDADGYRLPTEAEWEYACRSGTSRKAYHTGDIDKKGITKNRNLDQAGWYGGNSEGSTHPVASPSKKANHLGLFDMHGNAAEWCWDLAGTLLPEEVTDPRGAEFGEARIIRGGSWLDPAANCRAAYRGNRNAAEKTPSVGFRPARNMPLAIKN
jgi:sulfatase modifying factor 1